MINFYMDDSGTRNPDHKIQTAAHGRDWFALGGILINEEDENLARQSIQDFKYRWPKIGSSPLHSVDIRHKSGPFRWLGALDTEQLELFMSDLANLLHSLPVIGVACVIDRPGYNHRYFEQYGRQRWALCKTAFSVVVERAVKHAIESERKLRVLPERCSRKDDRKLLEYYNSMKSVGLPFNQDVSEKYNPLTATDFNSVLHDFKLKNKSSPLVQIADLYLWPMVMGGYHRGNKPYSLMMDNRKLLDSIYPDEEFERGCKYSCFDLVERKD